MVHSELSPRHQISNANAFSRLLNPPTLVTFRSMSFLILDAPSDSNLHLYLPEFQRHNVTDLVRACNRTYSLSQISSMGIVSHEFNFRDGEAPPSHIIKSWLELVSSRFSGRTNAPNSPRNDQDSSIVRSNAASQNFEDESYVRPHMNRTRNIPPSPTIAVHCVAGLGRAPVLVAIALIEAGMEPLHAVEYIRARRRGAFNMKQVVFLDEYRRGYKKMFKNLPPLHSSSKKRHQKNRFSFSWCSNGNSERQGGSGTANGEADSKSGGRSTKKNGHNGNNTSSQVNVDSSASNVKEKGSTSKFKAACFRFISFFKSSKSSSSAGGSSSNNRGSNSGCDSNKTGSQSRGFINEEMRQQARENELKERKKQKRRSSDTDRDREYARSRARCAIM